MRSLCIFCGSNSGNDPRYSAMARTVGALLARRGLTLVYGGGRVGLMGAAADAALAEGGRVVGVIPRMLLEKEVGHAELSELHVVQTMSERKLLMGELADGFLVLPGGIGRGTLKIPLCKLAHRLRQRADRQDDPAAGDDRADGSTDQDEGERGGCRDDHCVGRGSQGLGPRGCKLAAGIVAINLDRIGDALLTGKRLGQSG